MTGDIVLFIVALALLALCVAAMPIWASNEGMGWGRSIVSGFFLVLFLIALVPDEH